MHTLKSTTARPREAQVPMMGNRSRRSGAHLFLPGTTSSSSVLGKGLGRVLGSYPSFLPTRQLPAGTSALKWLQILRNIAWRSVLHCPKFIFRRPDGRPSRSEELLHYIYKLFAVPPACNPCADPAVAFPCISEIKTTICCVVPLPTLPTLYAYGVD